MIHHPVALAVLRLLWLTSNTHADSFCLIRGQAR
jgi:hypothetical protein